MHGCCKLRVCISTRVSSLLARRQSSSRELVASLAESSLHRSRRLHSSTAAAATSIQERFCRDSYYNIPPPTPPPVAAVSAFASKTGHENAGAMSENKNTGTGFFSYSYNKTYDKPAPVGGSLTVLEEVSDESTRVLTKEVELGLPDGQIIRGKEWTHLDSELHADTAPALPPILCLHGWLDNAASFEPLAELLLERIPTLRLASIDFPGHGLSSHKPTSSYYTIAEYIIDVVTVLDLYQWDRVILLSHSMGAAISSLLAGTLPDRIHKLICVDHFGGLTRSPEETLSALRKCIQTRYRVGERQAREYASLEEGADRISAGNPFISRESVMRLVARGMEKLPSGGYKFRHDPRLVGTSPLRFNEDEVRTMLHNIAAPTLVMWGENRNYTEDLEKRKQRIALVKNITELTFKGTGHHLHLDKPDAVLEHVVSFLTA